MKTALTLAALLMSAPAIAEQSCGLKSPMSCRDTSELMWSKGTEAAIRAFLKGLPGNYLGHRWKTSAGSDAITVLGGPPDDPKPLPGGVTMVSACQAHNCEEKGAMVIDAGGRIAAIGILNHHCGSGCDLRHPLLSLFVAPNGARAAIMNAVKSWGEDAAANEYRMEPDPPHTLEIEIINVRRH